MFTHSIPVDHPLRGVSVPLKPKPHRQNVGLRPTNTWLLPGPDTPWQLTRKRHLFAARGNALVAVVPGFERDAIRASEAVGAARDAAVPQTQRSQLTDRVVRSTPTVDDAGLRLQQVSETVSEDICVMSASEQGWLLTGVAVAFPSHWSPVAKLGRSLDGIHDPVPGYPRIAGASIAAFDRIAANPAVVDGVPRAIWERFNWTLVPDDELCHTEGTADSETVVGGTTAPRAEQLWLRVERQTLTALNSSLVVFLIRTFLTPLPALTNTERFALVESLSGVSQELAKYRSWVGYGEIVRRWAGGS